MSGASTPIAGMRMRTGGEGGSAGAADGARSPPVPASAADGCGGGWGAEPLCSSQPPEHSATTVTDAMAMLPTRRTRASSQGP